MNRDDQLYVLKWMLHFAEADIGRLRPKELLNLIWELDAVLEGVLGDRSLRVGVPWLLRRMSKESEETYFLKRFKQARRLQTRLKNFLQDIFQKIKKARETEGQCLDIKEFDNLLHLADVAVKETALRASIQAEFDVPDIDEGPPTASMWAQWVPGSLKEGMIKIGRRIPVDENALIFHFLEAMDGLPLKSLQECSECGRWFLQMDGKERSYCSTSCRRKKVNRVYHDKRKKENPKTHEDELAEKREKAHERYKERVKRIHPNADVKRRPRKKTKEED